jgi:hypothetical protein
MSEREDKDGRIDFMDDSAVDAKLHELLGTDADDVEGAEDVTQGPSGTQPSDSGVDTLPETVAPTEPTTAPQGDDVERALIALRKEQAIPKEVIDTMTTEQIVAAGAGAQRRVSDNDRTYQRISALEKRLEESPNKPEEPQVVSALPAGQTSFDLEEATKPLKELLDDETAGAVQAGIKALADHVETRLAALEGSVSQFSTQRTEQELQSAQTQFAGRYRELEDAAEFEQKILPKMETLAKAGGYGNVTDCMSDALKLLYGIREDPGAVQRKETQEQSKRNGLAQPPTGKPSESGAAGEDYLLAVFNAIESDNDPALVKLRK